MFIRVADSFLIFIVGKFLLFNCLYSVGFNAFWMAWEVLSVLFVNEIWTVDKLLLFILLELFIHGDILYYVIIFLSFNKMRASGLNKNMMNDDQLTKKPNLNVFVLFLNE